MGWICPTRPSTHVANRWAPRCKKPCRLAVRSSRTEKLRTFSKKDFFRAHRGSFRGLCAVCHVPWLAYFLAVPAAPVRLNAAWVSAKTPYCDKLADLWHTWPYSQVQWHTPASCSCTMPIEVVQCHCAVVAAMMRRVASHSEGLGWGGK